MHGAPFVTVKVQALWNERVGNYLSVLIEDPPTRDRANLTPPQDGQRNVGRRLRIDR